MSTPTNPLQLGQTLYEQNELTIIATQLESGGSTSYAKCSYTGNTNGDCWSVGSTPLSIATMSKIIDSNALNVIQNPKQSVFLLTTSGMTSISAEGNNTAGFTTTVSEYSFDTSTMLAIVDSNPNTVLGVQVLFVGQDAGVSYLWAFNIDGSGAGTLSGPFTLTGLPSGLRLIGAFLCRCQTQARLTGLFMGSDGLHVADFGSASLLDLSQATPVITSVQASTVVSVSGCVSGSPVSYATAMLIATSQSQPQVSNGNQQIAICYPYGASGFEVTVLDYAPTNSYELAIVQTKLIIPKCAPAESNSNVVYSIAAGTLFDGLQQVVVAFTGSYGNPLVAGCVSLTMLEYDIVKGALSSSNEFIGCLYNESVPIPFASMGLQLSVGVYSSGTTSAVLGVAIVGCGGNLQSLSENTADLVVSVIPMSPADHSFAALPPNSPFKIVMGVSATALLCHVPASNPQYYAIQSDVVGNSVVLGPPTLNNVDVASQVLAYIQAMPFEEGVASGCEVVFNVSKTDTNGYTVSSDRSVQFSVGAGVSLGLSESELTLNIGKTYGIDFSNMSDSSHSTGVTNIANIEGEDMIVVLNVSYQVWTYPVYQVANLSEPDGSVAVIFPATGAPVQSLIPANSQAYGYRPRNQPGLLISYGEDTNALTDYSGKPIFTPMTFSVMESGSDDLTYDYSHMIEQANSVTVFNSLNVNASAKFNVNLFDYVPSTFGLNLSAGVTFSDTNTNTTTASYSQSLEITFVSGTVDEGENSYGVTPYVYFDDVFGCLMVCYTVNLGLGKEWKKYYGNPNVVLIRVYPFYEDPLLKCFSRSISFNDDDSNNISVEIAAFNASMSSAKDIVFTLYLGQPVASAGRVGVPVGETLLGSASLDSMDPTERQAVVIQLPTDMLSEGECVTVAVSNDGGSATYYWGVYPSSSFPGISVGFSDVVSPVV